MIKQLDGISDLKQDPRNANAGTECGLRAIEQSLDECGAGRSIVVDRDGVTIAGNKTLGQAIEKGMPVKVVQTDGSELVVVQRVDLDLDGEGDAQRRARRLALFDNRTNEVGLAWDGEVLVEMGQDDPAIYAGLFDEDELAEIVAGVVEDQREVYAFLESLGIQEEAEGEAAEQAEGAEPDLYPLAVVLSRDEYEQWGAMKERVGVYDDKALLMLLVSREE